MLKIIGNICVLLESKKIFDSYELLKDRKYETWLKDLKRRYRKGDEILCSVEVKDPEVIKVIFVG